VAFEEAIKKIPGQKSGIGFKYFFMLAGSEDLIKPDRMILGFLKSALQRNDVKEEEAQPLLREATTRLRARYPVLTPRLLDNAIWNYQRKQKCKVP